ncbi:LPS translocon maturation chaperone LptM [Ferrimonas lipolytica]|uniref:Lipoprotein n=1 Tax=Ferrimonas lipolytica TaxID=2724191 RepID=A0A6H1UG78_9GAMM|nr:lipoprotein [Ferrimonas lipolytica]QIZ78107.1 lipoprotein [Ferrimonas lipolytica]
MRRISLLIALALTLTACGQTGPLYMPEPEQDNQQQG